MPQRGGRKVAFSAKQKRQQLKDKRYHKKPDRSDGHRVVTDEDSDGSDVYESAIVGQSGDNLSTIVNTGVKRINAQTTRVDHKSDVNRFALQFFAESAEELDKRRQQSRQMFDFLPETAREVSVDEAYGQRSLDMPRRPKWSRDMTIQQLEANEHKYFKQYLDTITETNDNLSYFELNLETWRQLWRVIEMSDIILLVADIRHPVFHFPPSLYDYVVNEMKRDMILVLNKVDLVSKELVVAWTHYLKRVFPALHVVPFASYAGQRRKTNKKLVGKLRMASTAAKALQSVCQSICGQNVDLSNWKSKIDQELHAEELTADDSDDSDGDDEAAAADPLKTGRQIKEQTDLQYYEQTERFIDGVVTIGCVGHPNVGKSSLLNAIMGRKVVSVSRTPGHTKHFQTIFLTPTVRLCDCPGLVFPSRAPKELQVLMGCYPIAQLREPYSAVGYISQRIPVHKLLRLEHPNNDYDEPRAGTAAGQKWSAYDICESWAIKRGFLTAKAARPDTYRAANHLLRMALDGRTLCLDFFPPHYCGQKSTVWSTHPDVKYIETIRGQRLDDIWDEIPDNVVNDSPEKSEDDDSDDGLVPAMTTNSRFAVLQESD